ncbi:hypothetical protein N9J35_00580 [bacterium]|nr:hypothetical protein [bacterium]
MNAKNPFTVTSSWMTEDLSRHFDYNASAIHSNIRVTRVNSLPFVIALIGVITN